METQALIEVKAPNSGCFYRAPSPEADPYVEVGDVVYPGDPVCVIEAMKYYNHLEYEGPPGAVVEILVENNVSIKEDAVLIRVRPDPSLPPAKPKPAETVEGLSAELTQIAASLEQRLADKNQEGN